VVVVVVLPVPLMFVDFSVVVVVDPSGLVVTPVVVSVVFVLLL
jgi:hypothetical protein